MNFLLHIIQAFFITSINGYMLFAADLNDFKLIANKYMPAVFAEKLADIAADTSLFHANEDDDSRPTSPNESAEMKETKPPELPTEPRAGEPHEEETVTQTVTTEKTVIIGNANKKDVLSGIDIDMLVEKIKERLDKQYLEKYKKILISSANSAPQGSEYSKPKAATTEIVTEKDLVRNPEHLEYDYNDRESVSERIPAKAPLIQNEPVFSQNTGNMDFEEKDLTNLKDSYEEYQVPGKYDVKSKIEQPTESTTYKIVIPTIRGLSNVGGKKPKSHIYEDINWDDEERYDHDPIEDTRDKMVLKSSEIQAKTENMNYDDHTYKVTAYTNPAAYVNTKKVSIRLTKGTGIPIRERYTMSSPNYYASVPIVAEKYDFDEPLPEKDREHENLKYILNQPARINKKVAV